MSDLIKNTEEAGKSSGAPAAPNTGYGFGGGGQGGRGRGPGRGPRRNRDSEQDNSDNNEFAEKVVYINRSAKVVKGGRRFSFSALVVVGDKKGKVGLGLGKSGEVADAIRKGGDIAKGAMVAVSLRESTIPHEVIADYCGARVLLRPASPGTGIIAGKTMRSVLESVGIRDVLSKSLGSKNPSNVVKATFAALRQLRLREDIYRRRGIEIRPKSSAETPVATAS